MPQTWEQTREDILDRDDHTCRFCGTTQEEHKDTNGSGLEVHHIIPRKNGGEDEAANLVTLCRSCHRTMEELHGQAIGQMKLQKDYSEDLEELTRIYDQYWAALDRLEELLDEFVDGHPTFSNEVGMWDEMQGEGKPSMVSYDLADAFITHEDESIDIDTEWKAAAAFGYKKAILTLLIDIDGATPIPIDEYRER